MDLCAAELVVHSAHGGQRKSVTACEVGKHRPLGR